MDCFKKLFSSPVKDNVIPFPVAEPKALKAPAPASSALAKVKTCPVMPAEYLAKYEAAKILPSRYDQVMRRAELLSKYEDSVYAPIGKIVGCPWWAVAVTHNQENGSDVGRFKACLHNGQVIIGTGKKTTLVPAGRGPFKTFQEAAIDALGGINGQAKRLWDIGHALAHEEAYNGLGYRNHGVASPYLWSFTDQYTKGHYGEKVGADGKPHSTWMPEKISQNFGVAAIMIGMGIK